jgi:(2Fe-2S) ferredoxin
MPYFQRHLFFCTNLRQNGKRCCAQGDAQALRDYAKQQLKKRGLHGPGLCRVNTAGCLDRCEEGPVLVIYPEGVWYSYKTHTDIDEIIEEHIIKGQKVTRLLLSSEPPCKPSTK